MADGHPAQPQGPSTPQEHVFRVFWPRITHASQPYAALLGLTDASDVLITRILTSPPAEGEADAYEEALLGEWHLQDHAPDTGMLCEVACTGKTVIQGHLVPASIQIRSFGPATRPSLVQVFLYNPQDWTHVPDGLQPTSHRSFSSSLQLLAQLHLHGSWHPKRAHITCCTCIHTPWSTSPQRPPLRLNSSPTTASTVPPQASCLLVSPALVRACSVLQWAIGVWLGLCILRHSTLVHALEIASHTSRDIAIDYIHWFMTAHPAGIKLHAELCHLLGEVCLTWITWMSRAARWSHPWLSHLALVLIFITAILSGVAGAAAMAQRLLLLVTSPVAALHVAATWLYRWQLYAIRLTWRMMRSKYRSTRAARAKAAAAGGGAAGGAGAAAGAGGGDATHGSVDGSGGNGDGGSQVNGNTSNCGVGTHGASVGGPRAAQLTQQIAATAQADNIGGVAGKHAGIGAAVAQPRASRGPVTRSATRQVPQAPIADQARSGEGVVQGKVTEVQGGSKVGSDRQLTDSAPLPGSEQGEAGGSAAAAAHQGPDGVAGAVKHDTKMLWGEAQKGPTETVPEELFVGVLLFLPLAMLLPTTLAWHLLICSAHLLVVSMCISLRAAELVFRVNPLLLIVWSRIWPHSFPGSISLDTAAEPQAQIEVHLTGYTSARPVGHPEASQARPRRRGRHRDAGGSDDGTHHGSDHDGQQGRMIREPAPVTVRVYSVWRKQRSVGQLMSDWMLCATCRCAHMAPAASGGPSPPGAPAGKPPKQRSLLLKMICGNAISLHLWTDKLRRRTPLPVFS